MDHTIIHFEIPAANIDKLKEFYAGLFGWKIVSVRDLWNTGWFIQFLQTTKACCSDHE